MSLYFAPANRKNLESSIEREVSPARLAPHVPSSTLQEIQARAGMEGIRCWAMTLPRRSFFHAMQPGDIVLLGGGDEALHALHAGHLQVGEQDPWR